LIGAIAGYTGYPLIHGNAVAVARAACDGVGVSQEVVACTLSPDQIEHLSARIAPAVVERLAGSGLPQMAPDPNVAAQQRRASEQMRHSQAAAFAQAERLVDQMIAAHDVTLQGRMQAEELLRQSGQADRMYEIDARISAAINRGEITPAQAGMGLPPDR
jgi:hypothetical protein